MDKEGIQGQISTMLANQKARTIVAKGNESKKDSDVDTKELEEEAEDTNGDEEEEEEDEESKETKKEDPSIKALREQNLLLSKQLLELTKALTPKEDKKEKEEDEKLPELVNFVAEDDEEFDPTDPKKLNLVLTKMHNDIITTVRETMKKTIKSIPSIVDSMRSEETELSSFVNRFYNSRPDLIEKAEKVGWIANGILSKNPELNNDHDKFFIELSKEVEEIYGKKPKSSGIDGTGTRSGDDKPKEKKRKKELSEQQQDMVSMLKTVDKMGLSRRPIAKS